jgi:hypothetical protein
MKPAKHEATAPDIRVAYGPVGRETLAAIAEELAAAAQATAFTDDSPTIEVESDAEPARPAPVKPVPSRPPGPGGRARMSTLGYEQRPVAPTFRVPRPVRPGSSPDLSFGSAPAGRETLAAIAEELTGEPTTGVRPRATLDSAPDAVAARPAGRETLQALEAELESRLGQAAPESGTQPVSEELEVFEMATFVVRGRELARLSSQKARRDFVEERLKHRLPIESMDQVDHVDVTPWTVRGTVILRVWCRVLHP